jgi:hypothetical protein
MINLFQISLSRFYHKSERSKAVRNWNIRHLGRKSRAWVFGQGDLHAAFCFEQCPSKVAEALSKRQVGLYTGFELVQRS